MGLEQRIDSALTAIMAAEVTPVTAASPSDDINRLIAMDDTAVRKQVGKCFTAQMQYHPTVHGSIFPNAPSPPVPIPATDPWIGDVAGALVAWSLSQTSQHGFARAVDGAKAKAFIAQKLTPKYDRFVAVASINYGALFPTYCAADKVPFSQYLKNQPDRWGELLADALVDPAFAAKEVLTFDADPGSFYQRLYCNIYKVYRLSPGQKERVVQFWDNLLKGRGAHAEWTIYEYMQADKFSDQSFMPTIQAAINQSKVTKTRTDVICSLDHCFPKTVPIQYTYGIPVADWLSGHKGYPFVTGTAPGNVEDVGHHSGCCFTRGTPVLMADGSIKPIETITRGEPLLGRDGVMVRRSSQDVVWDLEEHEMLFGFNEYPPFFNASHPFLTKDGWKAISPTVAKRINPELEIGRLQVGDILYQVESTDPFRYREVEIKEITQVIGDPSEKIYSLHLHRENPGYHAHGFCVAVNYPELTEDSFARAFAKLTAAERAMVREHLAPIMPLLKAGMGNFVQQALERSLADRQPGEG